jgi:hypothetical protein
MFTKKGDAAVLAKLGDTPAPYREIGERLHRIIRESAPSLEPIVRWGLPFYVKDGKDICYIKPDKDFIAFGFGEVVSPAREEGAHMHPIAWTLTWLDEATEAKIRALVKKAVGLRSQLTRCEPDTTKSSLGVGAAHPRFDCGAADVCACGLHPAFRAICGSARAECVRS